MPLSRTRREFVRDLGVSAAAVPFLLNLPSLGFANQAQAEAADRLHLQPERHRPARVLAGCGGRTRFVQGNPHAARTVPQADAHAARPLRQDSRRRRRPHARHRLSAHRHRTVPRQHPGRLRHARPAGPRASRSTRRSRTSSRRTRQRKRASARWSSASWFPIAPTPGRAWSYAGREQADHADRRPVPDVQQALRPREGPRGAREHPRRREGRPEEGRRRRQRRGQASCSRSTRTFVREMEKELKAVEGRGRRPPRAAARAGRQGRTTTTSRRSARCRST